MKIIKPSFEFIDEIDGEKILKKLELCGRVCYKSEDLINDTAEKFIKSIIQRGHESILEHVSITVRIICERGVSHEIVRHRLAGYSQESTRYCNYYNDKFGREITVINPYFLEPNTDSYQIWKAGCKHSERVYFNMLN